MNSLFYKAITEKNILAAKKILDNNEIDKESLIQALDMTTSDDIKNLIREKNPLIYELNELTNQHKTEQNSARKEALENLNIQMRQSDISILDEMLMRFNEFDALATRLQNIANQGRTHTNQRIQALSQQLIEKINRAYSTLGEFGDWKSAYYGLLDDAQTIGQTARKYQSSFVGKIKLLFNDFSLSQKIGNAIAKCNTIHSQSWIISRMRAAGFDANLGGVCFGYTEMQQQSAVLGQKDMFDQRINLIRSIPIAKFKEYIENDRLKGDVIEIQRKHKLEPKLEWTPDEIIKINRFNQMIDIQAFFGGICQFQNPEKHLDLFSGHDFFQLNSQPSDLSKYINSYIFLNNTTLYYVNDNKALEEIHIKDIATFKSVLSSIQKNKNNKNEFRLSNEQIKALITSNSSHIPSAIKASQFNYSSLTSNLIQPGSLQLEGGRTVVGTFYGTYDKSALAQCFKALRQTPPLCSVSIQLGDRNHAMSVFFDHKKQLWHFLNINSFPIECTNEDQLSDAILRSQKKSNGYITLGMIINSTQPNKEDLLKKMNNIDPNIFYPPRLTNAIDCKNTTGLLKAILKPDIIGIKQCLDHGVNPNLGDPNPLWYILNSNNYSLKEKKYCINLLIKSGAVIYPEMLRFVDSHQHLSNDFSSLFKSLISAQNKLPELKLDFNKLRADAHKTSSKLEILGFAGSGYIRFVDMWAQQSIAGLPVDFEKIKNAYIICQQMQKILNSINSKIPYLKFITISVINKACIDLLNEPPPQTSHPNKIIESIKMNIKVQETEFAKELKASIKSKSTMKEENTPHLRTK